MTDELASTGEAEAQEERRLRAILLDDDPECPTALHPVQTLAALADYAQEQAAAHASEAEDPDAIRELVRDGIEVVRQLQDFAFAAGDPIASIATKTENATPFLSTSDAEIVACADCSARLANAEGVPLYGTGWPLALRCEHLRGGTTR